MRFMRLIVAIAVVTLWCFAVEAGDRKSSKFRCKGECAVAVALAHSAKVAATERKVPLEKPGPTATITPANQTATVSSACSSGSCGTASRFSRRGR